MANPIIGRTFSQFWMNRIMRVVEFVERSSGFSSTRRHRTPLEAGGGGTGVGGSTDGGAGGGCCCNEANCIKPILGITGVPKPDYRVIPYIKICGCTGGGTDQTGNGGAIHLFRATPGNDDVWEQKHGGGDDVMQCHYPDCSAHGEFEWNGTGWDLVNNSNPACGTPPDPDFSGTSIGQPAETDFVPGTFPAYWKETKGAKDANGCDQSKLELIIDDGN